MKKHQKEFEVSINGGMVCIHSDIKEMSRLRHCCVSRRHSNPEYEVTMILKGTCQADVGDRHYTLCAGQAIIIPPGIYHILRAEPGEFDRYSFRFSPRRGQLLLQLKQQLPEPRQFVIAGHMEALCSMIFEIYAAKPQCWNDIFSSLVTALLLYVLSQLCLGNGQHSANTQKLVVDRMLTVDRYIEKNLAQRPTIEELARVLELSPRQTVRVLQENYGMTFRQKLLHARMDRAAWLLRTTQKPLNVVIGEVGYSSVSAFYQVFRERYGMTPYQYREQSVIK